MSHDPRASLAADVLNVLSKAVMQIGPLLEKAYAEVDDFEAWVIDNLPLQVSTAERIRAMYALHQFKAGHPDLPEPYKALWDLT